ncbi:MAG: YkgJ family cysteine cluster protein [Phycisphaerales bacterium]|nr:YkgJ family cysteine cluster protein [Phycisphaerales bacterium]
MTTRGPAQEWWETPAGADQMRFRCTMCGSCCSGPEGYVVVSEAEIDAMAAAIGVESGEFVFRYTHLTSRGRSLRDVQTARGHDCVFLDRTSSPGRALCRAYQARPAQCRTWPFWPSILASEDSWRRAKAVCPGMGKGPPVPLQQVRVLRDEVDV